MTWTNVGVTQHTATLENRERGTGMLENGQSNSITFEEPGNYYMCRPRLWMYGQIIVEK